MFVENPSLVLIALRPRKWSRKAENGPEISPRNRLSAYSFDCCYKTSAICPGIGANGHACVHYGLPDDPIIFRGGLGTIVLVSVQWSIPVPFGT